MSKKFYKTLSDFKRANRFTYQEIADLVGGVSASAVHLWVVGQRVPKPEVALRIADRCGVPLKALLTRRAA